MKQERIELQYMDRALELAATARGRTSPNPLVGAVVVQGGKVVGEGFHPQAGQAHAEVFALEQAGDQARGADLYVTLEPCCHHGLTPPCAERIVAAGIKRVIAAMTDPNPLVSGQGFARLREANIEVIVGVREQEARYLNEAFITYITKRRPFVTAKWAMTLDGKIACASGDSRWVSGTEARQWVHELRDQVDAIMVGIGTVLADDPFLTTRLTKPDKKDPIRIILDSHLRTPPTAKLLQSGSNAPTWIACLKSAVGQSSPLQQIPGVELLPVPAKDGRIDLQVLLTRLAERKLTHILLEGGSTVNYAALQAGLIDKIYCLIAPKLVGGASAPTPVGGRGRSLMNTAWLTRIHGTRLIGEDLLIEAYPKLGEGEGTCSLD